MDVQVDEGDVFSRATALKGRELGRYFGSLGDIETGQDQIAVLIEVQRRQVEVWNEAGIVPKDDLVASVVVDVSLSSLSLDNIAKVFHLLSLASLWIQRVTCAIHVTKVCAHARPHLLSIMEQVEAMLVVHARDAIQQVALQTKGDGCTRWVLDGVAGLRDVDTLDGLARQLAAAGFVAQVGDQPVVKNRQHH